MNVSNDRIMNETGKKTFVINLKEEGEDAHLKKWLPKYLDEEIKMFGSVKNHYGSSVEKLMWVDSLAYFLSDYKAEFDITNEVANIYPEIKEKTYVISMKYMDYNLCFKHITFTHIVSYESDVVDMLLKIIKMTLLFSDVRDVCGKIISRFEFTFLHKKYYISI